MFEEFKARRKLNMAFTGKGYKTDPILDRLFYNIMNDELEKMQVCEHYIVFKTFKYNGRIWNANKYSCWLSRGYVKVNVLPDDMLYQWDGTQPSATTMVAFRDHIEDYVEAQDKEGRQVGLGIGCNIWMPLR